MYYNLFICMLYFMLWSYSPSIAFSCPPSTLTYHLPLLFFHLFIGEQMIIITTTYRSIGEKLFTEAWGLFQWLQGVGLVWLTTLLCVQKCYGLKGRIPQHSIPFSGFHVLSTKNKLHFWLTTSCRTVFMFSNNLHFWTTIK